MAEIKSTLTDNSRQLADVAARVIVKALEIGLPDAPDKLVTPQAITILACAYVELITGLHALHDLVDLTDPRDPVGVALTKAGLASRPRHAQPRLVRTADQIAKMSINEMRTLYWCASEASAIELVDDVNYIVRHWDGMDGCWTDCTAEVNLEAALREWCSLTQGGARNVSYAEIDYYKIFPGDTRMKWDGSEGREMHR